MAVEPAGKHDARDRRDRRRLRRAAARPVVATGMRRVPHDLAGGELQGKNPTTGARVHLQLARPKDRFLTAGRSRRHSLQADIRDGDIDVLVVGGHAPLHAAKRAALADAPLPQHGAVTIRIERVHHAGFLPRDQRALAVR